MIQGQINAAKQAVVTLTLSGPKGKSREVDVVVDTGFSNYLTIPPSIVADLGLTSSGNTFVRLADGRIAKWQAYSVTVAWIGGARLVDALVAAGVPLLGMSLMEGYRLSADIRIGGRVRIEA